MNKFQISNLKFQIRRGFTLIELLVVMAVMGILAVGLLAAIDPADKVKGANDSKVISDIGAIAKAAEARAANNNGNYPSALTLAQFDSELRSIPTPPTGYAAYAYTATPASCTTGCTGFTLYGQLKSNKYSTTPVSKYETSSGKQCITTGTWTGSGGQATASGIGSC